jgi:hypothetical protein
MRENFEKQREYLNPKKRLKKYRKHRAPFTEDKGSIFSPYCQIPMYPYKMTSSFIVTISLTATEYLTSYWELNIKQKVFFLPHQNAVRPAHVVSEFLLFVSGADGATRLPSLGAVQMMGGRAGTLTAVAYS